MSHLLPFAKPHRQALFSIVLLLFACTNLRGAGFTVSPATISNNYSGNISFVITSIPVGATVRIEEFVDMNNNGTIDSADMLVISFQVTDGQVTAFGGVTDSNVPGDQDSVAGQITTSF